jgi:hypothetical protein
MLIPLFGKEGLGDFKNQKYPCCNITSFLLNPPLSPLSKGGFYPNNFLRRVSFLSGPSRDCGTQRVPLHRGERLTKTLVDAFGLL